MFKEKIPGDIIHILKESGFDTNASLSSINEQSISEIEQYVSEERTILKGTSYENCDRFKFKPGHKSLIMSIPHELKLLSETENSDNEHFLQNKPIDVSDFSFVLQNLITTAQNNAGKHPKGYRYGEIIRDFATYIYLLSGRACYESLSANLPIPQVNTICNCHA